MRHLFRVLALILSVSCLTSGTANITGGLSFDCAQNGSMLIFGTEAASFGSIHATQTIGTDNDTECTSSRHGNDENVIFEIQGCNISFPIKVILMHEKQDSTDDAAKVVGGKESSFYNLTCNNIPIGGLSFETKLNLTESEQVTYKPFTEATLNVKMEVRVNGSSITNKPVLIGTELQLSISCEDCDSVTVENVGNWIAIQCGTDISIIQRKRRTAHLLGLIKGNLIDIFTNQVGFNLFLEICIATDVSHKHNKTLLLKGASMDMKLLSNFTDVITPTVLPVASSTPAIPRHSKDATLYAFHFVGSNSIELVCNITICQSDDNSCPSNHVIPTSTSRPSITGSTPATSSTMKSSPPNSARRKRNIPVGPRTETLRTDLWVVDTITDNVNGMEASGTSEGPAIWMCLVVLAASVACTLK